MVIISVKIKDQGFEIFFESGFPDGNHCLIDHAASQKIANPFN